MLLHASCIALGDRGVLLAGPPGAGKSDLALRLIDDGGLLVADDQCCLNLEKEVLMASAPASIAGLIEIRHVGLMKLPFAASVAVALYVELTPLEQKLKRLPDSEVFFLLDQPVQRLRLPAFAASTPAKIRATLAYQTSHD